MPWDETTRMEQRVRFIDALDSCLYTMTELCAQYGISRKTGYKWAQRYAGEGIEGLQDRSRAPKSCTHRMAEEISEGLLELRRAHPTWGPRKLLAWWQVGVVLPVGGLIRGGRRLRLRHRIRCGRATS